MQTKFNFAGTCRNTMAWFRAAGIVLALASLAQTEKAWAQQVIQHRFLVLEFWKGKVLYVDEKDPSKNWEMPWGGQLRDWQLVGKNRLMISCGDGYRVFDLLSRAKVEEVRNPLLKGTTTVRRRKDGTTWIGANQGTAVRIFALDAANAIQQTITLPKIKALRLMRFTKDNTLLLADYEGAVEISLDPKATDPILRRFKLPRSYKAYMALQADDGTYWVAGGFAHALFQYKADGTLMREFQAHQPPGFTDFFYAGFQFLKNGHVVQVNWTGHGQKDLVEGWKLIEFDAKGNVVWHWHAPQEKAGALLNVLVLDDLDTMVFADDTK